MTNPVAIPISDLQGHAVLQSKLRRQIDQRQSRAYGALGIALAGLNIAEITYDPVALKLCDKTSGCLDLIGTTFLIRPQELAHLFGVELREQRRGADQIAEHSGKLTPLDGSAAPGHQRRCF